MRWGVITAIPVVAIASGCTLISLDDLHKGGGGAGGGSTTSTTHATTTSSASSGSTSTGGNNTCSPHNGDTSCGACLRDQCCGAVTACVKNDTCQYCSNCLLQGNPASCPTKCKTNDGMSLEQCANAMCATACN